LGAISIFWEIIARGPKNQKNIWVLCEIFRLVDW
jgi:hypothetical protein